MWPSHSSFIASSKNPNESIHGKGFVARLSGSTIEFISMWKLMFFGKNTFSLDGDGTLMFTPQPAIPDYLIDEKDGKLFVSSTLLSKVKVTYVFDKKGNYFPGGYEITDISGIYDGGESFTVPGGVLTGEKAHDLRDGRIKELNIKLKLK